jgi:hypothetical protein
VDGKETPRLPLQLLHPFNLEAGDCLYGIYKGNTFAFQKTVGFLIFHNFIKPKSIKLWKIVHKKLFFDRFPFLSVKNV